LRCDVDRAGAIVALHVVSATAKIARIPARTSRGTVLTA
jgi:hypothetical protein